MSQHLPADLPPALAEIAQNALGVFYPKSGRALGKRPVALEEACRSALQAPMGQTKRLDSLANSARVGVVISDATRDEPRSEMIASVMGTLRREVRERVVFFVASGTHAPRPAHTVLPEPWQSSHEVVVHDGHADATHGALPTTPQGTPVHLNRNLLEMDHIVVTGRVRPHYFAGFSGGAKGIFPGLGRAHDIRVNHLLKARKEAGLGRVADNPCRLDLEAAIAPLRDKITLLNTVADVHGDYYGAFAGDVVEAHREAVAFARPLFEVEVPRSQNLIVADRPPASDSLYQASKMLPPAIPVLAKGGTILMWAPCPEGIGPVETVNEDIYQLGMQPKLPKGHRVLLISDMTQPEAAKSYATPCDSFPAAMAFAGIGPAELRETPVLWRAAEMITLPAPWEDL